MKFPVVELVDRYTIAIVKHERTNGANQAELDFYQEQMAGLEITSIADELSALAQIHREIWDMENDFKRYRESEHTLEELGRRALAIRDLNHTRILLKNNMAEKCNDAVREIKQYG